MPLDKLWEAAAQGSQWAKTHTNLAGGSEYRVGVGLSQTAQALAVAIRRLQSDSNIKTVLMKEVQKKAMAEATALLPHLDLLNRGKGSEEPHSGKAKGVSFAKLKASVQPRGGGGASAGAAGSGGAAARPKDDDVAAAAKALHAWLSKPKCPLRALLSILAGGGAFWTAYTFEKVARAGVHHQPLDEEAFAAAAVARLAGGGSGDVAVERGVDDSRGLFS